SAANRAPLSTITCKTVASITKAFVKGRQARVGEPDQQFDGRQFQVTASETTADTGRAPEASRLCAPRFVRLPSPPLFWRKPQHKPGGSQGTWSIPRPGARSRVRRFVSLP